MAVLTYVTEIIPEDDLRDPIALMKDMERGSPGMAVLLHFLHDFGLPWLGFRNSIRANQADRMDSMYALAHRWFLATKVRCHIK